MNTSQINAFDRYQEAAKRTANFDQRIILDRLENNPDLINLLNYSMGAAGEAGEVVDLVKKIVFHGHALDDETTNNLLKECGDNLWYIANTVRILKTKLSKVAAMNIDKLSKRYPEGFDEQKSINREG